MQITCQCGRLLNVPDTLAGKQARCPACKNVFKVEAPAGSPKPPAAPPAPAGKVVFSCTCGRTLSAPAAFAGRKILCPACSHELVVPASPATTATPPPPEKDTPSSPGAPDFADDLVLEDSSSAEFAAAKPAPGAPAKDSAPSITSAPAPEPEPTGDDGYGLTKPKCPNCKSEMDVGSQFCVQCGTSLTTGNKVAAVTVEKSEAKAKTSSKQKLIIAVGIALVVIIGGLTTWVVLNRKKAARTPAPAPADTAPETTTTEATTTTVP